MTAPLDPFRCAVVVATGQLVMRRGGWRLAVPLADYPKWLALYRGLRDRKGGQFARFYTQPVEALEAIGPKVKGREGT